jgi:signal transduction histidine kinase
MTLQAKLTLGSVLLATLIVSFISVVDLGNLMQLEFEGVYQRADLVKDLAKNSVLETLNRPRERLAGESLSDPLSDPELMRKLVALLTSSKGIFSIDVVQADNNQVVASALQSRVGARIPPPPDFGPLVKGKGWLEKMKVLFSAEPQYYMLQEPLGSGGITLFFVRVIIYPAFLREPLTETFLRHAKVAGISVAMAVFLTFLFSMVAFRKLGRIGQMLDLATRGEYEVEKLPPAEQGTDELSVMASKVTILGQRLRGAQFEVSDLRGNIDRLLQDLEDAVFVFNREMRLVFASGSVEKFLGRERTELPGRPVDEVFPPSTMLGLLVSQAAETGRPLRDRRVPGAESAAGPAVVLLSVDILESVPGRPGGNSGILVRLRDPEAQRKINRELQTADRLAAISKISSGVAHEVKNPLNAMLLHVEVARAKLARGDTDVGQQMEIIAREIVRLDRVVRTFLDFTRPVELKLVTVSMRELVHEIVELARPQTNAGGIQVTVLEEADGVDVRVDRDLFKQAVLNIVVNAMQAMPAGGELRFEATAGKNTVELRISDTGEGISEEIRNKIFRLYFTTKREGSGIGLAMTFRIIQLHDGTIDFTSEPEKGTTFRIRLPIAV